MSKSGRKMIKAARQALHGHRIMQKLDLVEAPRHHVAIVSKKGKLIMQVHGMKLP